MREDCEAVWDIMRNQNLFPLSGGEARPEKYLDCNNITVSDETRAHLTTHNTSNNGPYQCTNQNYG